MKKVLLQRGSCIPLWMRFLARFYPFVFCYRCVERLEDQFVFSFSHIHSLCTIFGIEPIGIPGLQLLPVRNEPVVITRLSVFKNWAMKRCAICGKKIDVPI